jgi:pyruvate kinase
MTHGSASQRIAVARRPIDVPYERIVALRYAATEKSGFRKGTPRTSTQLFRSMQRPQRERAL